MKGRDKEKDATEKAQTTITLKKFLLQALEDKAVKANTKPSKIIEFLIQRYVMDDEAFFIEMARYHAGKMYEYQFLRDQLMAIQESKGK